MLKITHIYSFGLLQKALFCLGLFLALGTTGAFAQFAVTEDFRGSGNPDIIIGDQATLTSGNADPVNQGWLRLTPATKNRKGHAYINRSFPSTLGVLVDFEYKMWRTSNDSYNGADGIGVFLFDGTVDQSTFSLGGYGGSLGYAPNGTTQTGLNGGYVGIGIDAFGNFANPNDGPKVGGPGERPNAVVLRGPTTNSLTTTNRFLKGASIRTTDGVNFQMYDVMSTNTNQIGIGTQNAIDYNVTSITARPSDATFYRRIQIEIRRLTTGGEYEVIVRWKTSTAATSAWQEIVRYTTTDVPPALMKLGFAAATGEGINFHEIRNLLATTPNNLRVVKRADKDNLRGRTVNNTTTTTDNQITYTIEITNDTSEPVTNIVFRDTIKDGNGVMLPTVASNNTAGGFFIENITTSGFASGSIAQVPGQNVIAGNGALNANTTGYITVRGRLTYVPAGNVLINTASGFPPYDLDLNNNTSTTQTAVIAEGIDLLPLQTTDDSCVDGSTAFNVQVFNSGTDNASYNRSTTSGSKIIVEITYPNNYVFTQNSPIDSNNGSGWNRSGPVNNLNGTSTYTYSARGPSNGTQQLGPSAVYQYPILYTLSSNAANLGDFTTRAVVRYTNVLGLSLEASAAQTNNTVLTNLYSKPNRPVVSDVYYCQGSPSVDLTATKSNSSYQLKWYYANGSFSSDFAPKPSTETGGTQVFYVTQVNGTCESERSQINVYTSTTPTPGAIAGNQTICTGNPAATITSTNAGTIGLGSMKYRWEKLEAGDTSWSTITGAEGDTYAPGSLNKTTSYRRYTVSTNGTARCESEATSQVTVTVSAPTPGTIGANQTVCYNTAPNAITTASGAGNAPTGAGTLTYKWEVSVNGGAWNTVNNVTTESYTPGALTVNTRYRRSTVSNGTVVCTSGVSNIVTIEVQGQINPGTLTAASNQTICANSRPNVLANATDASITNALPTSGLTYRWESATNTNGPWATIANGTTNGASYTFPTSGNGSTVAVTTYYRRVAVFTRSSDGKACQEPTAYVTVTVGLPSAGSISADQIICKNSQPAKLTSASGGAGSAAGDLSYQWYSSNEAVNNFNPITGATEEGYQPGNLGGTTYFLRTTKSTNNGVTCESARTNAVKITVVEFPTPGQLTNADKYACYNTAPTEIVSSGAGTGTDNPTITYAWQQTTNAANTVWSGDIPNATSANYTPGPLTQTTSFRRFTIATYPNAECRSTSPTNTVKVNVSVVPTSGTIKNDQVVCSGTTPNNILNDQQGTGSSGLTYLWQSSTDGVNWTNLSTVNPDYQPQGGINQTTYYRRFGISKNGTAECYATEPSNTVTVTVPVTNGGTIASAQTICYGTAPQLLTSATGGAGTGTNITYKWQAYPSNGSAWADISNATNETYQPGTLTVTTRYRRVTTSTVTKGPANCSTGTSNEIIITVAAQVSAGSVGSNQIICYNTVPATLQPSGSTSTTNYRWDSSPSGNANTWTPTGVTTADFKFTAPLTQTTYYRRATISGSCEAYTTPVVITVMSRVEEGSISGDQNICMDTAPARIGPGTEGSGQGDITYKWESLVEGSTNWTVIAGASEASYLPPVIHKTTRYRRTTISTSVINGFTSKCESASTTGTVVVTVRNCKVITNPMIYQKVKN